jgi:DNA-binding transcriptional regulator PaaX
MREKLSKQDIILITLAMVIGGAGTARTILRLTERYIREKLRLWEGEHINEAYFRTIMYRLKKGGFIAPDVKPGFWQITKQGKEAAEWKKRRLEYAQRVRHGESADTIIVFDIPEKDRKKRGYLRSELLALNFKFLQKSVWTGTGPLPASFIAYLKDLQVLHNIHIFSIKHFGTIEKE